MDRFRKGGQAGSGHCFPESPILLDQSLYDCESWHVTANATLKSCFKQDANVPYAFLSPITFESLNTMDLVKFYVFRAKTGSGVILRPRRNYSTQAENQPEPIQAEYCARRGCR